MLDPTPDHDERIEKARVWIPTYIGKHILKTYRKRFGIDGLTAIIDLGELGVYNNEQLTKMLNQETLRLEYMSKGKPKKPKAPPKKNPKRRCINCGRAMTQQFIGLKHCKCGMSWKKDIGYFEREPGMVFCLEWRKVGKKYKQVPSIRY